VARPYGLAPLPSTRRETGTFGKESITRGFCDRASPASAHARQRRFRASPCARSFARSCRTALGQSQSGYAERPTISAPLAVAHPAKAGSRRRRARSSRWIPAFAYERSIDSYFPAVWQIPHARRLRSTRSSRDGTPPLLGPPPVCRTWPITWTWPALPRAALTRSASRAHRRYLIWSVQKRRAGSVHHSAF